MRDVDELIRALDGPPPPQLAPAWPERRRRRWPVVAATLALAASLLLAILAYAPDPTARPRGFGAPEPPVVLDMRMVVERGGIATRITPRSSLRVGERVLFRAQATVSTEAVLWVDGPAGRERVVAVQLDPTPRDIGGPSGLVGYRFDAPGRYTFSLSAGGPPPCEGCAVLSFQVTP